jgi:hypothetical protein
MHTTHGWVTKLKVTCTQSAQPHSEEREQARDGVVEGGGVVWLSWVSSGDETSWSNWCSFPSGKQKQAKMQPLGQSQFSDTLHWAYVVVVCSYSDAGSQMQKKELKNLRQVTQKEIIVQNALSNSNSNFKKIYSLYWCLPFPTTVNCILLLRFSLALLSCLLCFVKCLFPFP